MIKAVNNIVPIFERQNRMTQNSSSFAFYGICFYDCLHCQKL